MPKLCPECQKKKPDTSVRGTCIAPTYIPQAKLPKNHLPWTESANFTLCDACEEQMEMCAWCLGPLDGGSGPTVPTEKTFCRQFEKDNGGHVKGMYVGEQICAQLPIDLWSGIGWGENDTSYGINFATGRVVTEDGRTGWQEMYFDLDRANAEGYIELIQKPIRSYWWWTPVIKNAKTWRITVEVKQ